MFDALGQLNVWDACLNVGARWRSANPALPPAMSAREMASDSVHAAFELPAKAYRMRRVIPW